MNEGRLADRAYTAIVRIINDEGLAIGDRLPSEARLAETFGMSRTIVREALARLASDGITEARRGAGSYVKRRPSERLGTHMPMDELAKTLGTYEVRFVLEAETARLAALRRSSEQMEAIEQALVGGSPMNPRVAARVLTMFAKLAPPKNDYALTAREKAVLECMVAGMPRKQIAEATGLNLHTADYVTRAIYRKLHVNCATAAVSLAVREGLVAQGNAWKPEP